MLVRKWMSKAPFTIKPETTIYEALDVLKEKGFRRLPVVDHDGVVVGIVTDRDLKEAAPSDATSLSVYEVNSLLSKLTVKEIMTSPIVSIGADDVIEEAALIMHEKKISGLPVFDNGKLVGMITITDILAAFVDIFGLQEGYRLTNSESKGEVVIMRYRTN